MRPIITEGGGHNIRTINFLKAGEEDDDLFRDLPQ
jgi:hypothetical protein